MLNLLLLGCLDGAKEETGDSVPADPCISEVTTTFPADGAVDVYVRAPLSFYLTQADTVSEGGPQIRTDIPGRLSVAEQGRRIDWVPEGPLVLGVTYQVSDLNIDADQYRGYAPEGGLVSFYPILVQNGGD